MRAVEFDKIKFCFDFCFPKAAEAVRSRQLQNDRLTFQQIKRVYRFRTEHSPIDKEQKRVGEFF